MDDIDNKVKILSGEMRGGVRQKANMKASSIILQLDFCLQSRLYKCSTDV